MMRGIRGEESVAVTYICVGAFPGKKKKKKQTNHEWYDRVFDIRRKTEEAA